MCRCSEEMIEELSSDVYSAEIYMKASKEPVSTNSCRSIGGPVAASPMPKLSASVGVNQERPSLHRLERPPRPYLAARIATMTMITSQSPIISLKRLSPHQRGMVLGS
jgi:hypothetical protein